MSSRALVYGLAVAGASTVRALQRHGIDVVVADDSVTDARSTLARELGVELIDASLIAPEELLAGCSLLCPAPGVPEHHAIITAAQQRDIEILSEVELAYRWEQDRPGGPRPMLAVTGTDGKTSTTKLAVHMLASAGLRSVDAGNTDTPLVDAIDAIDRHGNAAYDAFVVECSSFRLAFAPTFRAEASVWLNIEPDHLNWHRSMATYEAAKARVFAAQISTDVAIGFAPDDVVMKHLQGAPGRRVTFGLGEADYRLDGDVLVSPSGPITTVGSLSRSLPHDITNALAAAALVIESGLADADAVASALHTFVGPAHRLELLATIDGVDWFNDSKATTPHAASAAIRSFEHIILIAGGADKGVDLGPMAAEPHRVRGVVAIGTTGPDVAAMFGAVERVHVAGTLERAVETARRWAVPGDTVLLSPGCASLDQFDNFEARGDAFRALVASITEHGRHESPVQVPDQEVSA